MTIAELTLTARPGTTATTARFEASAACCAPLVREGIEPAAAVELARVFKALGDPTRVRLLSLVAAHEGAEACVCDLTEPVGLAQPTVSHHLKILVDAGLLTREKRGKWAYYAVVPGALGRLGALLTESAHQDAPGSGECQTPEAC